jgi:hypothetical protein
MSAASRQATLDRLSAELGPGHEISLCLPSGAEVFCASGSLRLAATEPWLGAGLTLRLSTGQAWRAAQATQVTLLALEPARYRLVPAPEAVKETRAGSGGLWLWAAVAFRRQG